MEQAENAVFSNLKIFTLAVIHGRVEVSLNSQQEQMSDLSTAKKSQNVCGQNYSW